MWVLGKTMSKFIFKFGKNRVTKLFKKNQKPQEIIFFSIFIENVGFFVYSQFSRFYVLFYSKSFLQSIFSKNKLIPQKYFKIASKLSYFLQPILFLSDTEALIHLIKMNVGIGVMAMPSAFYNSGLVVGIVAMAAMGVVTVHCMHLLVRPQKTDKGRDRIDSVYNRDRWIGRGEGIKLDHPRIIFIKICQ